MRSIVVTTALTASILLLYAGSASAADQTVACPLLAQAQIGSATGATVGPGSPIARPGSCQWAGQGKIVTLTINQPRGGKSPVDQFNDGKRSLPGVTIEAVSGVADDAYYVFYAGSSRAGCGIVVKKGSGVFEIRVYGFDLNQAKGVAKTLAQDAASKF
jgi:hypothetical protein